MVGHVVRAKLLFNGSYSWLHDFHMIMSSNIMMERKGKGYQLTKTIRINLIMKIQEVTSNVDITNKNEKQYVRQIIQLGIPGTQVTFSDKVTPDINGFY